MNEEIYAKGKLFELIHQTQTDGRIFEIARRAPGVRVVIADKPHKKILLTKEFRRELNAWDYRLPGGKVFDSLEEYQRFRANGDSVQNAAKEKAVEEAAQEAGVKIESLDFFKKSTLGATVEWDLYVFEAVAWQLSEDGQDLEKGEQIETGNWISYKEAKKMIIEGQMQEERIALLLLQWLERQGAEK